VFASVIAADAVFASVIVIVIVMMMMKKKDLWLMQSGFYLNVLKTLIVFYSDEPVLNLFFLRQVNLNLD
jgi:hypothetical protein